MRSARLRLVDGRSPVRGAGTALDAEDALTTLYATHYTALVRLASLLLDETGLAEEVVQDAYVQMHGRWHQLRDPDAGLAYLRKTVVNLSRSRLRRRQVAARHAPKPDPDMPSAEYSALGRLEEQAVAAALARLPTRQREALVLRYYSDLTGPEIAAVMGISEGAVKSHTSRAMTTLRMHLDEEGLRRDR